MRVAIASMKARLTVRDTAAGGCVLIFSLLVTWLSSDFVYGEGHAERPIPLFLVGYAIGWLGFLAAGWRVMRKSQNAAMHLPFILVVALAARLIMLPSGLIQEIDCYRYVLDGTALLHGVNPFAYAPRDIVVQAPHLFAQDLPGVQNILSRVGYKSIPTIYPPLAQFAFAMGAWLTPWDWMGQRIVFLAADILTIAMILVALRACGRPRNLVLLYAWNPIVLKEVANSAHLDSLVGLCLVLCVLALERRLVDGQMKWVFAAAAACAGAILVKIYPLVILPAVLVVLLRTGSPSRAAAIFCVVIAGLCLVAYLPFIDIGPARLTAGLRIYGREWVRNEGAFGVIAWLSPLPRPTSAAIIIFAIGWICVRYLRGPASPGSAIAAVQQSLLVWFLFIPAVYPWYAIGLIAVSALRPRVWVLALSGLWGLYYMLFYYEYNEMPDAWNTWTRALEHGLLWLAIGVEMLSDRRGVRTVTKTDMLGASG